MKNNKKQNIKAFMRGSSSGFTLVELIVCFAILSVVALCVSVMMNAGTNLFVRVSKSISLSNKTQIALTQMKEYFIDCNAVLVDDNNGIYVASKNNNDGYDVYHLEYSSEDKTVNISECTVEADKIDEGDSQKFASDISNFEISFDDELQPKLANVNISAQIGNTTYSKNQSFYMRCKPDFYPSHDQLSDFINFANGGGMTE